MALWSHAATYVQVLEEKSKEFLQEMNSQAIAPMLKASGLIPARLEPEIKQSKCKEDSNSILFTHLIENATKEQVLEVFTIASSDTSYGRMCRFVANILQQLQQG